MTYVRWLPTGSYESEARSVQRLDYRLRRLESQAADFIQPLVGHDPDEYVWQHTGPASGDGYWVYGDPEPLTVDFVIPTEQSWATFAFGFDSCGVVAPGEPTGGWGSRYTTLDITLDGGSIWGATGVFIWYWQATKDYDSASGHRGYQPSQFAVLYPLDLAPGAHQLKLTYTIQQSNPDAQIYMRNRFIRGYVQA